jgi:hypothetical protein
MRRRRGNDNLLIDLESYENNQIIDDFRNLRAL